MRSRLLVSLLAALVWAASAACVRGPSARTYSALAPERAFRLDYRYVTWTLPNGVRVLVFPDASSDLAQVNVRYLTGAGDDPASKRGLAHLVEHLTFELRPIGADGPALGSLLGGTTLRYNAYTTYDETHYSSLARRENVE